MNQLFTDESLPLNKKVKIALAALNKQNPFANFDIQFLNSEKASLANLDINHSKAYNNFGNLAVLEYEVSEFVKSLGKNASDKSESIANLITKLVNEIILALEKKTAWVTIRATTPSNDWDISRWHSDGYYYSPHAGEQYKIAITLKGPSTLFYPLPDELREKFNSLQFNPENKEIIANMLNLSNAISVPLENGAIFIVGTDDYAAVHSEPPIHEDRLFLSVVPGNKTEIEELHNRWSTPIPKSHST